MQPILASRNVGDGTGLPGPQVALEEPPPLQPRDAATAVWADAWRSAGVASAVILASTFRSGSTRVAATLGDNGVPGLGKERFQQAWRCVGAPPGQALAALLRDVLSDIREDGTFATKIMWPHLVQLGRAMGFARAEAGRLAALFGPAAWIQVRRDDKIAQAISFWRAKMTGRWHVYRDEPEPQPPYDFDAIRACLHEIELDDRLWDDFFVMAGIAPVRIIYERFEEAPGAGLRRILAGIGRPVPDQPRVAIRLRRQRDGYSEVLRERFLDDFFSGRGHGR